ncbi:MULTISPECIES: DUF5954 family protein [unclassified Streptomyces]|uniref:DUF5954 family protein n=1 Tax=unclassified Streptomyces TaxID=2593676 RepID=UPI0011E69D72|nr:DUF5954 family protein [Streptomyces sp. sk2.1]TXS69460.1 hypothetical protein EAO76_25845 [Streptomyces sp. sk2.1]
MSDYRKVPPDHLVINVRHRDDPVSLVTEADAFAASRTYKKIVVRGPLFGIAEQRRGERPRWRMLTDLDTGYPQDARDELNSRLWFKAKDETDDPRERRALLDAVARLETEPVDELTVGDTRYRVVRADEFARTGEGRMEPPRPTDVDSEGWDVLTRTPSATEGFVIDHAAAVGLTEGLDRMGLVPVAYTSERFPPEVLADSRRALRTHPGLVLLPVAFRVVERREKSWSMVSGQLPTPQDARRALVDHLQTMLPRIEKIDEREAAVYARAADAFTRRLRPNELTVRGRCFEIARIERMMRIGPAGPEGPRRSDISTQEPSKIHPTMDEWGNIEPGS